MNKVVIGIDPDSKAHGVAVYINDKLVKLNCLPLIDVVTLVRSYKNNGDSVRVNIENVCGMNAVFRQRQVGNGNVNSSMAKRLGMCQQAQTELMRMLDHYSIEYKLYKISKMWKKDKAQFELATGWKGRSNEDTRSAAYFGFLN